MHLYYLIRNIFQHKCQYPFLLLPVIFYRSSFYIGNRNKVSRQNVPPFHASLDHVGVWISCCIGCKWMVFCMSVLFDAGLECTFLWSSCHIACKYKVFLLCELCYGSSIYSDWRKFWNNANTYIFLQLWKSSWSWYGLDADSN